jgi:hypothetical protein
MYNKKVSMKRLVISLAVFFLFSCSQSSSPVTPASKAATYYGESKPMGDDSIRSWIKTDLNGNPSSIGVTFPQSAFAKIESDQDTMFMMMLPMLSGSMLAAPFDHIEVNWSKKGDPKPPYNVSYFDAHFFTVDEAAQSAVMAGVDNQTMMMDSNYLPSGYKLDDMAEAMMGVHAIDTTDMDNPFNHTAMYGFYHGDLYFIEPMFSKTYLDSKTTFSADIRQPKKFKRGGWYPTKYTEKYDGTTKTYSISIDNFVSH